MNNKDYLKHYYKIQLVIKSYKAVDKTYQELTKDNEVNTEFTN